MPNPIELHIDDSFLELDVNSHYSLNSILAHGNRWLFCHGPELLVSHRDGVPDATFGREGQRQMILIGSGGTSGTAVLRRRTGEIWILHTNVEGGVRLNRLGAAGQWLPISGDPYLFAAEVAQYYDKVEKKTKEIRYEGVSDIDALFDYSTSELAEFLARGEARVVAFKTTLGEELAGYDQCRMVELNNGRVLVALSRWKGGKGKQGEAQTVLLRLNQAGHLDRTFGTGGSRVITSPAGEPFHMTGLLALRTGGVVVYGLAAGERSTDEDYMHVLKVHGDGELDRSFADQGGLKVLYSQAGFLNSMQEAEDGVLYGGGFRCREDKREGPLPLPIVKISQDGRIDSEFQRALPSGRRCWVLGTQGTHVCLWSKVEAADGRDHLLTLKPDGGLARHVFICQDEKDGETEYMHLADNQVLVSTRKHQGSEISKVRAYRQES